MKKLLARLRQLKPSELAWVLAGYALLWFLTLLFAFACYRGRQAAAVNLLIYCTALLYVLPPKK